MFWWKSDVLPRICSERLLQANRQPILVPAGDQRGPRCCTYRRIRICLRESHTFRGNPIDIWSRIVTPPVAGNVGIPKIVGHNEHDIRRTGLRNERSQGRCCEEFTSRQVMRVHGILLLLAVNKFRLRKIRPLWERVPSIVAPKNSQQRFSFVRIENSIAVAVKEAERLQ